jgi:hypothetical protein
MPANGGRLMRRLLRIATAVQDRRIDFTIVPANACAAVAGAAAASP